MSTLALLRHWARTSRHPAAVVARHARGVALAFTLPAPRVLVRPYLWLYLGVRGTLFFLRRVLVAEPLFKAYCTRVGRGVTTGIHVPWVQGSGELVVGDHVRVSGKISISYAASFTSRPRLEIGDHSDIAHETRFVLAAVRNNKHNALTRGSPASTAAAHCRSTTATTVARTTGTSRTRSTLTTSACGSGARGVSTAHRN